MSDKKNDSANAEHHSAKEQVEKTTQTKKVATNSTEPSYLIPGSIVMAGIIIAMAVFASGGGSGNVPTILDSRVASIAQAAGLDAVELQECSTAMTYESAVAEDIANAISTGGQGTPWTVVHDTVTDSYYPINGALPPEQIDEFLANDFAGLEITEEQQTALRTVTPVASSDYVRGNPEGRYIFIEYSDFDCPFCSRFHQTMKSITETRDDVAWVYRHIPLEQLHPDARFVANVIECAGEGGENPDAFWSAADAYFR